MKDPRNWIIQQYYKEQTIDNKRETLWMKRFGEVVSIFLSSKAVTRVIERLILVHFGKHCIDIWRLGINVKKKKIA